MSRVLMERSGEMEVFVKVVQEGAFSAAARSLDLTPSAISKLIGRLETRLGTRLFVRTTRAIKLTEDGEAYHKAAVRIIQEINDADQSLAGNTLRGELRVNASVAFGSMFIAPAVPSFIKKHPDVIVDLSFADDVVDLIAQKTDIAIRTGNLPDSSLIAKKLAQSRRVVCASPAYLKKHGTPQIPSDLIHHECMTFNFRRSRIGWPFKFKGRDLEQSVSGNLKVNNGETMKQLALAGVGICRVGLFHVEEDIKAGRLVLLLEKYNPGDVEFISAVYVGGGHTPKRVRAFIDHIVDSLDKNIWK